MVMGYCPEPRLDPPEPKPLAECDLCGAEIFAEWYEVGNDFVLCSDCFDMKRKWARIPSICPECGEQIEEDDPVVVVRGTAYCPECVRKVGEC